MLAKQAATIDSLSEGRMVLGMAVGGREDDSRCSGVEMHQRGQISTSSSTEMTKVWSGESGSGRARSAAVTTGGADRRTVP